MERLTNNEFLGLQESKKLPSYVGIWNKLVEYENLEITPEQVREMSRLYQQKCEEVAKLEKTQNVLLNIISKTEFGRCYMCGNVMKNITIDGVNNGCDGACGNEEKYEESELLNKIENEIRRKEKALKEMEN